MNANESSALHFEYRGWFVDIEVLAEGECFAGHADLKFDGKHRCRVVLATGHMQPSTARWALDSKARDFIDEWSTRSRRDRMDANNGVID